MRTWNLVACLVAFLTILLLSVIFQHNMFDVVGVFAKVKVLRGKAQNVTQIGSGKA